MSTIQERYKNCMKDLCDISKDLETRIQELEKKEENHRASEKLMEQNIANAKQKIKLDIGGKHFTTSRTTLLRFKDSYFYSMLANGQWKPDEDGTYFIDRNPKYFDILLDYMRTGEISLEKLDEEGLKKIQRDAEYFQIPLPLPIPVWDMSNPSSNLSFSGDGTIATKNGNDAWDAAVLSKIPVKSFKVRILNRGSGGNIMIGLAPKNNFQVNGMNYSTCGYYLYVNNGTLYSQNGDSNKAYLNRLVSNSDTVEVNWNSDARTILFKINSNSGNIAFQGIQESELYAAVNFYDANSSVQILSIL